ncbi:hypothetical protein IQ265_05935 [Nodosilinea sp. LEGE 06152]|uniref:hypothetical protein n=1 Tax=Nodosilinea sp. LEGE 06152 TaxID=2777966 RepID=UPI001881B05B|nr:hypothetical protein [Nodosilinea sp. LEGE 06152]
MSWQFPTSFPSHKPENAGIIGALVGTFWVMIIVPSVAFPVGVGAGLYLEKFSDDG